MASNVPQAVIDQIAATKGVMASATALINAILPRIQAAVDAALANGATEAELAPVQTAVDEFKVETDALASAVAANA